MSEENIFTIKEKYHTLKKIASELHWMARRYADGRQSYVTHQFNEITRMLQSMEIDLKEAGDGTVWARDAMGRSFDGLSEKEASQGNPVPEWKTWDDEEVQRLRSALSFYAESTNYVSQHEPFAFKEFCSIATFPAPIDRDRGKLAGEALKGKL
jgi:hypothetical protein